MYGNNIASNKFRRLLVQLKDQNGARFPGMKYFLPDDPEIDRYFITGIEVHLGSDIVNDGDLNVINDPRPITPADAAQMYLTIYSPDNSEKNYNIPLLSIFPGINYTATGIRKTVKPYYGKIKTKSSYITIPANALGISEDFVYLTFYYE
jgi:hypothetical protein